MKIELTTEAVTLRPSDSAEPSTLKPSIARDQADDQRHERRLDQADQKGVEADGVLQSRQEGLRS